MSEHFDPSKPLRVSARVVGCVKVPLEGRLVVDHAEHVGVDYASQRITSLCSIHSRFVRCKFDGLQLDASSLGAGKEMSEYTDCTFDGSRLCPIGGRARFVRCSFRDVVISDWICLESEFVDCVFSGRMKRCVFNGAVPVEMRKELRRTRNEFHGNDFSGMKMVDVGFRTGVDLRLQRLPTGPEFTYLPDATIAIARVKADVQTWTHPEARHDGEVFVQCLELDVAEGQSQLFLRLADFDFSVQAYADRFRAFLEGDIEKIAAYREQGTT